MPYEASVQDRSGDTADEGLELDAPDVLTAFRMANRSIATAIRQRSIHNTDLSPLDVKVKVPKWHFS